jgi:hypothetical protein
MKTLNHMDHFYIRSVGEAADHIAHTAQELGGARPNLRREKLDLASALEKRQDAESIERLRCVVADTRERIAVYEQSIARAREQIVEFTRAAILGE